MNKYTNPEFIADLKDYVRRHPVLRNDWLTEKKRKITRDDIIFFLTQEYYVSVDFVNWFLLAASLTDNQTAKTVLVENIWEELGEGNVENSHVNILVAFLLKIGFRIEENRIMEKTSEYLFEMKRIIGSGFYTALGALGPANEYLLKLEYGKICNAYNDLRKIALLPEASFFDVNLKADLSHSEKMFRLIDTICDTDEKREAVYSGNTRALEVRMIFYEGLMSGSFLQKIH